jgi:dihydrofolate reductase
MTTEAGGCRADAAVPDHTKRGVDMRKLRVFNLVSLDGYIADAKGDMSWAHQQDEEWNAFVAGNAQGEAEFVFGRRTYELMAAFWPTPFAMEQMPGVAKAMNANAKVVFSRTLETAVWEHTRLVEGDPATEVRKLKQAPGPDLLIFGSGSLIAPLAQAGLIDTFQLVVNALVLGGGTPMFGGLQAPLPLKRTGLRAFGNGNVLLDYEPVR